MKSHDLGCGSGAGGDNKDVLNVSVVNVGIVYQDRVWKLRASLCSIFFSCLYKGCLHDEALSA